MVTCNVSKEITGRYSEAVVDFAFDNWIAQNWWDKPERMSVEDAEFELSEYRREGREDIPDDVTPEAYAALWNACCNEQDKEAEFDAIVNLMDDEIREDVHRDIAPCTEEEFLAEYCKRHHEKYGVEFEPIKTGGQW